MTLKELTTELDALDTQVQKLRRAELEIEGDVPFTAALRQHINNTLGDIRLAIDHLVSALDRVHDVDQIMELSVKERLMGTVRKLIGPKEET